MSSIRKVCIKQGIVFLERKQSVKKQFLTSKTFINRKILDFHHRKKQSHRKKFLSLADRYIFDISNYKSNNTNR